MADKKNQKHNLPKKLIQGKTHLSQESKPPVAAGGGGRIDTSWKDINWTPKKLSLVICALSIPYLIAVTGALRSGKTVIALMLIGLGLFVGLLYLAVYLIDKNDF